MAGGVLDPPGLGGGGGAISVGHTVTEDPLMLVFAIPTILIASPVAIKTDPLLLLAVLPPVLAKLTTLLNNAITLLLV